MSSDPRRSRVPGGDPGIEIALLDWGGDGPPVLLHHANGFCGGLWGEAADGLRGRFRVIAMDARGHGDSSKPADPRAYAWEHFVRDAVAVAEGLAAEARGGCLPLAIGHSFGGTSLLAAAARRPELFARLLLVDPVIYPPERRELAGPERPGAALAARTRERRDVWPSRSAALRSWAEHDFFASWTPRARELYATWGLRERPDGQVELACPKEIEATVFEQGAVLDVFACAHRVKAPALLLWAARGSFAQETYEALAARIPDARVEAVEAGHLIPMERPDVVVEAALRLAAAQDSVG